jgi:hypothetical protein
MGVIGNETVDLYLLKNEFKKFEKLKSEGYDWPLILANDKSKLKSLIKNKSLTVSLTEIIDNLKSL